MDNNNNGGNPLQQLFGVVMAFAAIVILLLNIEVTDFGFYRIGNFSTAPVLIVIMVLLVVWGVATSKKLPWVLAVVDVLLIILSGSDGDQVLLPAHERPDADPDRVDVCRGRGADPGRSGRKAGEKVRPLCTERIIHVSGN